LRPLSRATWCLSFGRGPTWSWTTVRFTRARRSSSSSRQLARTSFICRPILQISHPLKMSCRRSRRICGRPRPRSMQNSSPLSRKSLVQSRNKISATGYPIAATVLHQLRKRYMIRGLFVIYKYLYLVILANANPVSRKLRLQSPFR